MGGKNSGTPPAAENLRQAIAAVQRGECSLREAQARFGINRETIAKYLDDPSFRLVRGRCGKCGAVVDLPCVACNQGVQSQAEQLHRQRLAKARRRKNRPAPA